MKTATYSQSDAGFNNQKSLPQLLLVLLFIIVATALRLYQLDKESFWFDEGYSAYMAQHASIQAWSQDAHPPLYYALLAAWSLVSQNDYWQRLLSVIFGVATLPIVYLLGRQLFSQKSALWSVAIFSILSFHIRYSHEARMYTLIVFLFACALWGLLGAARSNSRNHWIVYTVSSILLSYSHGLGVVYSAILAGLFPLYRNNIRKLTDWLPWIASNAIIGIFFLPWLGVYLERVHDVAQGAFWSSAPTLNDSILVLRDLTVGSIPFPSDIISQHLGISTHLPGWLWVTPIALLLGITIIGVGTKEYRTIRTLVAAYILPIIIIYILSLAIKPIFLSRTFLPATIPLVLLMGASNDIAGKAKALSKPMLVISMIFLLTSTFYHLRYVQKEQWRQSSQYLQQNIMPGDTILYNVFDLSGKYLINRYDVNKAIEPSTQVEIHSALKSCDKNDISLCLDKAIAHSDLHSVFWVVSSHDQYMAKRQLISAWLKHRFACSDIDTFLGVGISRCTIPMENQGSELTGTIKVKP